MSIQQDSEYSRKASSQLVGDSNPSSTGISEAQTNDRLELRKKELRSMVGEKYTDLIAAADTIINMDKRAKIIQRNFERMQDSCDVYAIQRQATKVQDLETNGQDPQDQKRRQLYVLAAMIKSLADVPEQIWHALEGHHYLQAGSLYILAQKVHDYLETEDSFLVDIDIAFPVIQRQWDAISFFRPQIIQKSVHHLRAFVLDSEDVAKILVGLMLMDGMTMKTTIETLLDMRKRVISDLIQQSIKEKSDFADQKLSRQLREIALLIRRTLVHIHDIYLPFSTSHQSLLSDYVEQMQTTFTIPNYSSNSNNHNNSNEISQQQQPDLSTSSNSIKATSSTSSLAITRLFSPSANAHLLIRYLPPAIQQYTPTFNMDDQLTTDAISAMTRQWLDDVKEELEMHLETILQPVTTTEKLLDIRARLWDLLRDDEYGNGKTFWSKVCQDLLSGQHYSIFGTLFRNCFNGHARYIVHVGCQAIVDQPSKIIWPMIEDSIHTPAKKGFQLAPAIWPNMHSTLNSDLQQNETAFSLPNQSSSSAILAFKESLTKASTEQTPLLCEMQRNYDKAWAELRLDVGAHLCYADQDDHFYSKTDADAIKSYFQDECVQANVLYIAGLNDILGKLKSHQKNGPELSIWVGRLARLICEESKELPRSLAFSMMTTEQDDNTLELKSGVGKDPIYQQTQERFYAIYRSAYEEWIELICNQFEQQLSLIWNSTIWDDRCPSISTWEHMGNADDKDNQEDIVLPTMATIAIERAIFYVCEQVQNIHSTRLDKLILQTLCQGLHGKLIKTLEAFLDKDTIVLTEKGALQLLFDVCFLDRVLQDHMCSVASLSFVSKIKEKIDPINWAVYESSYDGNVERFYLKQSLLLGVLVRTNSDTFQRTRKAMTNNQQHYNVLPVAKQISRFTLLPIGHGTSIRTR
ncbi:uncharacterized protein BX664DRAFT_333130 [Halteromyces radiatus]|uniref:uncharacterized protein n=1 Tax=Halteromyces radiatus TaxID=101107 RepID=UPI00221F111D|nr:uncharacterized protein BX664DRAFT_333130 [Halteromyces radiatus]KAI8089485.1 hypothetical protein BX664DRAFT_333130 [Halteromyces radiatus]